MKTKLVLTREGEASQIKQHKSGYIHGYNSLGDPWGRIQNNTLLGYKILTLAYFSPSAMMDHATGTNIVFDKKPSQDLILTVNNTSKQLFAGDEFHSNWQKVLSPEGSVWHYNDGAMGKDFFNMENIYQGQQVRISLSQEIPSNAVLWDDNALWNDNDFWTETVEYVDAVWDDSKLWSDSDTWQERIPSSAYMAEMREWAKLAEKLKGNKHA